MLDLMTPAEALRSSGLRATPQRMAVFRAVSRPGAHLSAEEAFKLVRKAMPSISLATVYKALGELRDAGWLRELPVSGKLRFDINTSPHHHLVCERCRRVVDVMVAGESSRPRLSAKQRRGFEIRGAEVTFRGLCPDCREPSEKVPASKEQERRRAS